MKELDKWAKVHKDARILFEFMEWFNYHDDESFIEEADIYSFFKIDYNKLEKERAELLENLQ